MNLKIFSPFAKCTQSQRKQALKYNHFEVYKSLNDLTRFWIKL